jgi:peptidoglycan hydrolase-like protein with peptidoglycan-binding domain
MALQSKLFTIPRDTKLEACFDSDPAHITPGSRGEHVMNIQIALNQLSNVFLKIDGVYGPKTAAAVKAYNSMFKFLIFCILVLGKSSSCSALKRNRRF